MKLLYITNGINGSGGLERVLSIKASYFAEQLGYEVAIISLNGADRNPFYEFSSKIQQVSVNVGGNPLQYIKSYKKSIQAVVDKLQPDMISVCDDGLKAFFIPQFLKTKAKLIYERHVSKLIEANDNQSFVQKAITWGKWAMMDKLGSRFSKFVLLTEGNKNEWQKLKNLEVIANPLSFYPDTSSILENKVVICVGKISYQKGQDLLLKAWENVHTQYPDWQLHLYGKENLGYLDTNHLKNNVKFFLPAKDIEQKYLESSVYVMSSRYEGFGMVLIEAMACGVPCVSFDCDYGPSDIISNNRDGYLVEKENTNQLADRLLDLIGNQEKRKSFGHKAKHNVRVYSIKEVAKQWDLLFKSL